MTNLSNASGGHGDMSNVGDLASQSLGNNLSPAPDADQSVPPSDAEEKDAAAASRLADQPDDELLARDPVCGKVVNKATAPAFSLPQGANDHVVYYDSEECKRQYDQ